jgi:hypothetical protein
LITRDLSRTTCFGLGSTSVFEKVSGCGLELLQGTRSMSKEDRAFLLSVDVHWPVSSKITDSTDGANFNIYLLFMGYSLTLVF